VVLLRALVHELELVSNGRKPPKSPVWSVVLSCSRPPPMNRYTHRTASLNFRMNGSLSGLPSPLTRLPEGKRKEVDTHRGRLRGRRPHVPAIDLNPQKRWIAKC
jgi:hypothetical protein